MKIIIFNGPPSCGKDTSSKILLEYLDEDSKIIVVERRMSHTIKAAFAGVIGDLGFFYDEPIGIYETKKETPVYPFDVSYRQWQIDFSEKFMKPLYGEAIFVKLWCDWVHSNPYLDVILVPDCGFMIELETLSCEFDSKNLLLVRIQREGTSFANDSRSYLRPRTIDIQCRDISNNSTIEDFRPVVLNAVLPWLNQ